MGPSPQLREAGGASASAQSQMGVGSTPDLAEPQAHMSARTPLPPGKEGPRLGGLGGGLVAKAIPGPVRLWERHCPRAHVSWTRVPWSGRASKLGHIQHAGRPWGSREAGNWGPSLNAGQCPPPHPSPLCGKRKSPGSGRAERGPETRSRHGPQREAPVSNECPRAFR